MDGVADKRHGVGDKVFLGIQTAMTSLGSISRRSALGALAGGVAAAATEWVNLFDGHSLNGWKASEHPHTWSVSSGCLQADGPRSHLFYTGPVKSAVFRNFELEAEVMTWPGANSGIFFHTAYQEKGFPAKGFEVQINNTHQGEGRYRENKKTASLYGVRNLYKTLVGDNQWFRLNILVRDKNVQVRVNGTLVVDYTESTPPLVEDNGRGRVFSQGTFALQGHDPGSRVRYRAIRVRPLPDDARSPGAKPSPSDETAQQLLSLAAHNVPVVDYHVHL